MKLNVKAFALTSGILWGVGLFAITWWLIAFEGSFSQARSQKILSLLFWEQAACLG